MLGGVLKFFWVLAFLWVNQIPLFAFADSPSCNSDLIKLAADIQFPDSDFLSFETLPVSAHAMFQGYREGWYTYHDGWEKPKERAIYQLDSLSVRKSLKRTVRRAQEMGVRITINSAFEQVVDACRVATRDPSSREWLTIGLQEKYMELHRQGYGYSVEVWSAEGDLLVGSFGIVINGHVHAESMFRNQDNRNSDGMGFVLLAAEQIFFYLQGADFIDEQVAHDYKIANGADVISDEAYRRRLKQSEAFMLFTETGEPLPAHEFDFFSIFEKMEAAGDYRLSSLKSLRLPPRPSARPQ